MKNPKIVILIAGPSCSGKSTVEDALGEKIPGAYLVAFDKLKWQLYGFHRDRHRGIIQDLLFGFFEVVCKKGLPIFLTCYMHTEEEYHRYLAVAEEQGYTFFTFELTAPTDVLLNRFRERVQRVTAAGGRMSITNEDVFLNHIASRSFVPTGTPVFDTSLMKTEEIVEEILSQV